ASVFINNTANKHTIVAQGVFRIPTAGRNLWAEYYNGNGAPEGVVTAQPGSLYSRQDVSSPGIALWVKQSGTGNTGWLRVTVQSNGTTAQRPDFSTYLTGATGFMYYDTSLTKPIWWNGANWKDATGATV
ncbi:MAG TPA: hypothetical protein VN922_13645, partial [Bacteroidia bacterium]|nr:hypothetical protein [Bacteroidia bacterium]